MATKAEKLDSTPVRMGYVIPIRNQNKHMLACDTYFAVKTEDITGKREEWLMFSESELYFRPRVLIQGDILDGLKLGRLYGWGEETPTGYASYIVRLMPPKSWLDRWGTRPATVLIPYKTYLRALTRTRKNPEDIPSQSRLGDLLD